MNEKSQSSEECFPTPSSIYTISHLVLKNNRRKIQKQHKILLILLLFFAPTLFFCVSCSLLCTVASPTSTSRLYVHGNQPAKYEREKNKRQQQMNPKVKFEKNEHTTINPSQSKNTVYKYKLRIKQLLLKQVSNAMISYSFSHSLFHSMAFSVFCLVFLILFGTTLHSFSTLLPRLLGCSNCARSYVLKESSSS